MTHIENAKRAVAAELQELRNSAPATELEAYRRATENELAQSESKFRRLFETALDGILIIDAGSGEITDANPYLCGMLDYPEEELVGKRLWEIGPFQEAASSRLAFEELKERESIRYDDIPLQSRSGRTLEVEFVSSAYTVNGAKVIQCNIRDIADRKRAERTVSQNERVTALRAAVGLSLSEPGEFSEALRSCAEAFVMHFSITLAQIWVYDPTGAGLSLAANAGIAAQPDLELDGDPAGYSMIRRIVETAEPLSTNSVGLDPRLSDREWFARERIVAFAGYPLKVEGRVVGVLGLYTQEEISESVLATLNSLPNHLALTIDRQQRLRELEVSDERLQFAMESAHVGVWDIDNVSGSVRWSPIMEEQHGALPGSFDGTLDGLIGLVHPDDREAVFTTIQRAARQGQDYSLHYRTVHEDSGVRWLRGEGRFVLNGDGSALRGSGISLDITEQLALQEQDQQAQKMEAIGRLAGGVAHDFNNLLTVILSYTELLLASQQADDANQPDLLEIQRAGMRAAELTRQLLTFSRRSVIEPLVLDVNEVISSLLPMLTRLIGEDIKVVTFLNSGAARIRADRGQMEQVIVNLAVNARDAMLNGGTLRIESGVVELNEEYAAQHFGAKPGPYVVLTVTDTGAGIADDVLKHVFEPFFTTKATGEGTGLGLATVHGIVSQSGGSIGVHSEVGRGTSFKVFLPLVTSGGEPVLADSRAGRLTTPIQVMPRGGTETILVVEDSAPLRAVTRRLLEEVGYTVIVASNATEAQARFQLTPAIALVLSDVVMPGGNGPDLVAKLRLVRPNIRVIFMSGYSEEAISHHGVLAPGAAFLAKPFDAVTLRRIIRERLDK